MSETTLRGSVKLRMMLEEVRQAFTAYKDAKINSKLAKGQAKEAVQKAYEQAIKENFTPEAAKQLILSNIIAVSQRTLYLYLPDESKNKRMQTLAKKRGKKVAPLQVAARLEIMRQRGKRFQGSDISDSYHFPGSVFLKNEFAAQISEVLKKNHAAQFILTHDGKAVLSIQTQGEIPQGTSHELQVQEIATVIPGELN